MPRIFPLFLWSGICLLWLTACGGGPKEPLSSPTGSKSSAWTLPRLCTQNSQCKTSEYCKKSTCGISLGMCTTKPKTCTSFFLQPVTGCNRRIYRSLCHLAQAGQNRLQHKTLQRVSAQKCNGTVFRHGRVKSRLSAYPPMATVQGSLAVTVFEAPTGQTPFTVDVIKYQLLHHRPTPGLFNPNTQGCNATLGHRVYAFKVPANGVPPTNPTFLLNHQVVPLSPQNLPHSGVVSDRSIYLTLLQTRIVLLAGEKLAVAIEMNNTGSRERLCLSQCYDENVADREFLSPPGFPLHWIPSLGWSGQNDGFRIEIKGSY